MKIGITEFSFGYAFTENLIRDSRTGASSAPYFPNLIQEAQLGFDVQIDLPAAPLFFQYKLPELMVRDTAKEISKWNLPISIPFFRMPIMRRDLSSQHQRLMELEALYPGAVLYASPEIETLTQFNHYYGTGTVHENSALFSPRDIGPLPDNKDHVVVYQANSPTAWFCSEPRPVKARSIGDVGEILMSRLTLTGDDFLESVREARAIIRDFVPQQLLQQENNIRERVRARRSAVIAEGRLSEQALTVSEEILIAREFSRVGLGLDLTFAQPRPQH